MTTLPSFSASSLDTDSPHRRRNALTGEWVLVSPHRTKRPWQGKQETLPPDNRPAYNPKCYLCPGNARAEGAANPPYEGTFVFTNDFAALLEGVGNGEQGAASNPLFTATPVRGTCRVICFSPRHDLTIAKMDISAIRGVVDVWAEQATELGETYRWVQVFENKGEIMGCSNPHPHGQIWASDFLPNEAMKEDANQRAYYETHSSVLLLDYARQEEASGERVVVTGEHWLVVVPFWAVWPFETLLLPRHRQIPRLPDTMDAERADLAATMKQLLTRYDALFQTDFPYSMGWHGAPTGGSPDISTVGWQVHAHYYPPLLRSATVKKFMVGYEMLAEAQRDLTPEQAAERLRTAA